MTDNKSFTVDEVLAFYGDPTQIDLKKLKGRIKVDKKDLDRFESLHATTSEGGRETTASVIEAFIAQYLRAVSEYDAGYKAIDEAVSAVKDAKEKHPEEYDAASKAVAGTAPVQFKETDKQATANGIINLIRNMHSRLESLQSAVFNFQHAVNTLNSLEANLK